MPKVKVTGNRGWWREYFKDHLRLATNHVDASSTGKLKVMCLRHLDMDIAAVIEEDKAEVQSNWRVIIRSVEQIEEECKQIADDNCSSCNY